MSLLKEDIIISGAGVLDRILADFAADNGLGGFEFLACIPGTIGGGIKMNAGCFGREFKDILLSIQVIDKNGNVRTIPSNDIKFEYRKNDLTEDLIFLSASFKGIKSNSIDIKNERFIVSSENVKHRYLFDMIADKFSKPKASIKVTPLLKELAWRGELIKSFFTGRKPLLTKETARNAMKIRKYSNKKISQELNFVFTDLHLTVKKYCNWYINHIENPSQH